MTSRRFTSNTGFLPPTVPPPIMIAACKRRRQAVCRISSLPVKGQPVLGAVLNRSESYLTTESLKKIAASVPTESNGDTFAARRHHGFG
jgi:hypothetical protein